MSGNPEPAQPVQPNKAQEQQEERPSGLHREQEPVQQEELHQTTPVVEASNVFENAAAGLDISQGVHTYQLLHASAII